MTPKEKELKKKIDNLGEVKYTPEGELDFKYLLDFCGVVGRHAKEL